MNYIFSKSTGFIKVIGHLRSTAEMSSLAFKSLSVDVPKEYVYHVKFNRPEKRNAINHTMWLEIKDCFDKLSDDENCRAVVLSGEGMIFTAGIDLSDFLTTGAGIAEHEDIARKAKMLYKIIQTYQDSLSSLELCKKPVLAAVHSACIGAGVDAISAADIRYCTKDSYFQVKEVEVGLAADVGTLQRLPKILGSDSLVRELCYTGRKMYADEASARGLVSKVFNNKEELINGVLGVAEEIASRSPVAVQATKSSLVYSRDHSVQEGLDHIKLLNQLYLQSEDLLKAATAQMTKEKPVFAKL